MESVLAWTRSRSIAEAAAWSLAVNVLVFALALAFGALVGRAFQARRVADPPAPIDRAEVALAGACVVLNALVMLAGWALFTAGVVRVDPAPSVLRWLVDAVVLLVAMDLLMYVTHRLAHHPLLYRWVHGAHHRHVRVRPLTLFVLHPVEVLGFGGLWLSVLAVHAFSLGGMLVYLTWNVAFGVVGHLGVEPLPKAWGRPARLLGTSTFHARHHQDPTSNFGFYTTIWDRLFGSLGPRYDERFGDR